MERTMTWLGRWGSGALLAGLTLLAGLPALADGTLRATALVEATDAGHGTVTLAGHTYRVTSQTRLLGKGGQPIALQDLRAGKARSGEMTEATADVVEYELQPPSDVLDSLQVVDMMPR